MNKRVPYEESLRVPLLMRYPKRIPANSERDQMVLNVDIAPTLYDLVGTDAPILLHGKSLLPVLDDPEAELRDEFLAEYFLEKITPRHADWRAVRTERWKYIHYPKLEGMDELYDLQSDPRETTNLIGKPEHSATLERMRQSLRKLLQATEG